MCALAAAKAIGGNYHAFLVYITLIGGPPAAGRVSHKAVTCLSEPVLAAVVLASVGHVGEHC